MIKLVRINGRFVTEDVSNGMTFSDFDKIEQGYFITSAELEQVMREAFEAGWKERDDYYDLRDWKEEMLYADVGDYWQQKKKLIEKNVNEELNKVKNLKELGE